MGRLPLDEGIVTEKELAKALDEHKRTEEKLGKILVARGAVDEPYPKKKRRFPGLRLAVQIALAMLVPLLLPFLLYVVLYLNGIDVLSYVYVVITAYIGEGP